MTLALRSYCFKWTHLAELAFVVCMNLVVVSFDAAVFKRRMKNPLA